MRCVIVQCRGGWRPPTLRTATIIWFNICRDSQQRQRGAEGPVYLPATVVLEATAWTGLKGLRLNAWMYNGYTLTAVCHTGATARVVLQDSCKHFQQCRAWVPLPPRPPPACLFPG